MLIAMTVGTYDEDIVNLNVDSLWRGGNFENTVILPTGITNLQIQIMSDRCACHSHTPAAIHPPRCSPPCQVSGTTFSNMAPEMPALYIARALITAPINHVLISQ
jgi:hypothetical protein